MLLDLILLLKVIHFFSALLFCVLDIQCQKHFLSPTSETRSPSFSPIDCLASPSRNGFLTPWRAASPNVDCRREAVFHLSAQRGCFHTHFVACPFPRICGVLFIKCDIPTWICVCRPVLCSAPVSAFLHLTALWLCCLRVLIPRTATSPPCSCFPLRSSDLLREVS